MDPSAVPIQIYKTVFDEKSELLPLLTSYHQCDHTEPHSTFKLNIANSEHHQFLAYLSSRVASKWRDIGRYLGVGQEKLGEIDQDYKNCSEKSFQMMTTWATSSSSTLSSLLTAVENCNFTISINNSVDNNLDSVLAKVGHVCVNETFLTTTLSSKGLKKWRFIGSFLGLTNEELEQVNYDYSKAGLEEVTVQMFLKWTQKSTPFNNYKTLARAFFLQHQLDSTSVCAAWSELETRLTELCSTRHL